jgi:polyisoprenoid-binding protein YceI
MHITSPRAWRRFALAAVAGLALSACTPPTGTTTATATATATAAPVSLTIPSGTYRLDPTHASLTFKIKHLGLADYTARFARFDATLDLDTADLTKSKVTATVDPASVRTDYPGDYAATHGRTYRSWDDDLARNPRWFNVRQFPEARFASTAIAVTGPNTGTMTGDLTFLGVTKPITLDVTFGGQLAEHPFTKGPAIGFSAVGSFKRSDFGMTAGLPEPGAAFAPVADDVELVIEAEFMGPAPAPAAPVTP